MKAAALLLAAILPLAVARASDSAAEAKIARGRYLVEHVAMCVQCHTPRDGKGELRRDAWLQGGPVVATPTLSNLAWATEAPNISGLTGYTDEEEIRLLTTGIARDGAPPMAPMPPFRMTREDAEAVVAYLRSLRLQPVP
jgi:mono/diheme cytochrome c family protein